MPPDRTVMGCDSPSRFISSTRPASTHPACATTCNGPRVSASRAAGCSSRPSARRHCLPRWNYWPGPRPAPNGSGWAWPSWSRRCTTRCPAPLPAPLQRVSAFTAVDRLSHGRLDVGVAPGGGRRSFAAFGVDADTFISSFTEGLQLMKAAWSDEPRISFDGRFRQVDDLPIQPKPVQRPHPPIWFCGQAPKALARAVRHGDAFLGAGSSTTAKFAEAVLIVRRELAEQGKDSAHFPIGKRVYLMIDDDPANAPQR